MGESQLKRLKASLRAAGITSNQKTSKKSKGTTSKHPARQDKNAALLEIREEFNPFEVKTTREKYDIGGRGRVKGAVGRPGLSKQIGEDNRKRTLLVELQRRNKAGGIVDRRFGENDPTMTPEERMLERFAREKRKKGSVFNIDDDDEGMEGQLTHFGQALGLAEVGGSDEEEMLVRRLKKRRLGDKEQGDGGEDREGGSEGEWGGDGDGEGGARLERKKTKAEVMKEVIAKSKLHKYERQKAKEDDDDEREKLDAQMPDIWALLGRLPPSRISGPGTGANMEPVPTARPEPAIAQEDALNMDPGRRANIDGADAEYDARVREMVYDKRSQPAERTKTAEEKALEESERLQELEAARLRRMNGEEDSGDEQEHGAEEEREMELGDATGYGLGRGIPEALVSERKGGENPDEMLEGEYERSEDGYVDVDSDGVVGSGAEFSDDFDSEEEAEADGSDEDEDEDDFLADVRPAAAPSAGDKLAFTFPCPQTHAELLAITADIPLADVPTVVQRIRILHHPKLHADNKTKLSEFSAVLLEHILYTANLTPSSPPFAVLDTLIRHLHALAKSHPERVATAFRAQLAATAAAVNAELTAADLVLFTAIGVIFPTSDHFHQVTTPAMILLCKHLAHTPPTSLPRLAVGAYLVTLSLQWQALARRFVPEAANFVLQALLLLAPVPMRETPGLFPWRPVEPPLAAPGRRRRGRKWMYRKLGFADMFADADADAAPGDTAAALMYALVELLETMAALWVGKRAYIEVFQPAGEILQWLCAGDCSPLLSSALRDKIKTTHVLLGAHLTRAHSLRRPLELHHHRPLPIKSHIPKFEEQYNADRRYDPDRARAGAAKLRAEVKRERKGAMRELRKDARFVGREKLRVQKREGEEYHKKMRRLTAMVGAGGGD